MKLDQPFPLGQVLATPTLLAEVGRSDILSALNRHQWCDWGDVDAEDKKQNDWSVEHGERILSSYRSATGTKFWIITERDRSSTTVLLPSDY